MGRDARGTDITKPSPWTLMATASRSRRERARIFDARGSAAAGSVLSFARCG
jgi:hypothetical protein